MRQFTVEVLPRFPARVDSGAGIRIVKQNGVYTFSADYSSVGQVTPPTGVPTLVMVQLPDGSYATMNITDVAAANFPVVQTGKRNAFINGGFGVWQRNTTFTPTTVRMLTADRWGVATGAGTLTSVARTTGVFGAIRGPYGMIITGNTGVTVVDLSQRIEAINTSVLRATPPYVTFSAKLYNNSGAAFTPTLFVDTPNTLDTWTTSAVQNNGGAGDALQSCPNLTLTTLTWSADITGYANLANGLGFRLRFPAGALDANTKAVQVYDCQVEPVNALGDPPSLFEGETFSDELARCQRYYFKTFPYGTVPAQNATAPGCFTFVQIQAASLAQNGNGFRWPVVMRATPTVTLYNPSAVNALIRNGTTTTDWSACAVVNVSDDNAQIQGTTPAGSALGNTSQVHITADAEL